MFLKKALILGASIASASAAALVSPRDLEPLDQRDLVCPCDSTNLVVLYPILVDVYFTVNETINLGGFTLNINNAPTSISTVVTGTSTSTVTTTTSTTATSLPTINPATPFILQLSAGGVTKRQTSSFIGSSGDTQGDCHAAAVFTISSTGQLTSNGLTVSTNAGVSSEPFALSASTGSISTGFSVADNILAWSDSSFTGGSALFCTANSTLFAVFNGVLPAGCTSQSLIYVPASGCPAASTTASNPGTTASVPTPSFPTTSGFQNTTFSAGTATTAGGNPTSVQSSAATTAASTGSDGEEDTDATFITNMLYWHNIYRTNNQALPLTWNATLATYAQEHSDDCVFEHSGGPYGENLAEGTYQNAPLYIAMWYNEQSNYDFDDPDLDTFESWGHFTQVVWQDTTQVGCGYATTSKCQYNYLTCEYYPPGNFLDSASLAANVKRPISSSVPSPESYKI